MPDEFVTVAKLRSEMAGLLSRLDADAPLYVTQRGQARAVLLDVKAYHALIEQVAYLDDAVEVLLARERRDRGERTRPLAELIRERSASDAAPKRRVTRGSARVSR